MTHDLMTLTKLKDDCIVIGVGIGVGLAIGLGLGLGLVLGLGVGVIGSRVMSHVIATPLLGVILNADYIPNESSIHSDSE